MSTSQKSTYETSRQRPASRWLESTVVTLALLYGGWMLLDAFAPQANPRPASTAATHGNSNRSSTHLPFTDVGGHWSFAGVPWTVDFRHGTAAETAIAEFPAVEQGTLIADLEVLLAGTGSQRTSRDGIDDWQFHRENITFIATTQSIESGTVLLGIDLLWGNDTVDRTRMSLRPAPAGTTGVSTDHLFPMSSQDQQICGRLRSDGVLSLEVVRSRETGLQRHSRLTAAGWQRLSGTGIGELWENAGKRVSIVDMGYGPSSSDESVLAAILEN